MTFFSPDPDDQLRIAVAQLDAVMGDIAGNADRVRAARDAAALQDADLVVFPELFLTGAPPAELALRPAFRAACRQAVEELAAESAQGPALLLGTPWEADGRVHNAVLLLEEGRIAAVRAKVELARSAACDERRVFGPGPMPGPIPFRDTRLGVPVGNDVSGPDVVECLAETGAELLIVPAASAYGSGAADIRMNHLVARVVESGLSLLYVNMVGGQDGTVFDGASLALNADRALAMQYPNFQERVRMTVWQRFETGWRCLEAPLADRLEGPQADYAALMLGLRDHAEKNRYAGVLVTLDGSAASALASVLAVDAVGAARVHAVAMAPAGGGADALDGVLAFGRSLGLSPEPLSVQPLADAARAVLAPHLAGPDAVDPTRRLAGALLATLAEERHLLPLVPADRAACLLGAWLPVDPAAGALNPLSDISAEQLTDLLRLRAQWKPMDARGPATLTLPCGGEGSGSSGEGIIAERLAREGATVAALIADGFDAQTVRAVERRLSAAESARRGAPLGLAIGADAPDGGLRAPVTNRFQDCG